MRKMFLIFVAVLGITAANAQFERGIVTLQGKSTSFQLDLLSGVGDYERTALDIALDGSIFVIDRLAIKVELGIGYEKEGKDDATTATMVGAGARYYFSESGWFAGVGLRGDKVEDFDMLYTAKIEAGRTWYIFDHFFFEPAIQISKGLDLDELEFYEGLNIGLSVGIGVDF